MRKYILSSLLLLVTSTVAIAGTPPEITFFDPTSGPINTIVTIEGRYFTDSPTVLMNDAPVTPSTANDTLIKVKIPDSSSGTVEVKVHTTHGDAAEFFAVKPIISSFSVPTGSVDDPVTINGSGFGSGAIVKFGNIPAAVDNITPTTISTSVPPGAFGTPDVTVTIGSETSGTKAFAVIPKVTSAEPSPGFAEDPITVTGSGFDSGASVRFGSSSGPAGTNVIVDSDTVIRVNVPENATGTSEVFVIVDGRHSSGGATYTVKPKITSLSTDEGTVDSTVTINGSGFDSTAKIFFGGKPVTNVTEKVYNKITVKVPERVSGDAPVKVSFGSYDSTMPFKILPKIDSLNPSTGVVGALVEIKGSGFKSDATVKFGSLDAENVDFVDDTTIKFTVPTNATPDDYVVKVTTNGEEVGDIAFTVNSLPPPTIISLDKTEGVVNESIEVTGTGFVTDKTTVKFGDVDAELAEVTSSTKLTVKVPPGASGTSKVTAIADGSEGTVGVNFTVRPTIRTVDPISGPVGTEVTIDGTGFNSDATVAFGSYQAQNVTVVGNTIKATVPASASGAHDPVDIKVTVGSATSTESRTFTVDNSVIPTVTDVDPKTGPVGTSVTIKGTDFTSVAEVKIGGKLVTDTNYVDSTTLRGTVPAGATGEARIDVTVGAQTSYNEVYFLVDDGSTPILQKITPNQGKEGDTVVLQGKNFADGATVMFGNQESPTVTFLSSTEVEAVVPAGNDTVDVNISVGSLPSNALPFVYQTPIPKPTISSMDPTTGPRRWQHRRNDRWNGLYRRYESVFREHARHHGQVLVCHLHHCHLAAKAGRYG
ncbi:MAG: IPT/TIG domain-containing protein [Planctomycetaceae bacterium]|nr:IPT/TIG domain-containing protein [Planctomycetaceae bacterium]